MRYSFFSPATVTSVKQKDYSKVTDVVDRSTYRPDAEQVRALKVNPASGERSNPQYDYQDGKVPENDSVSDVILALRSGRLDKAEVDVIKEAINREAETAKDKEHADKLLKAVDKTLGIDDSQNSENSVQN